MDSSLTISATLPPTQQWSVRTGGTADAQRDFDAVLGKASANDPAATPESKARAAAEQFVAITLVQPLLKQMRESNQAGPPFGPSQGEKQFQTIYDAEIAHRMVKAAHFPLVDRLTHDLARRHAGSTKQDTSAAASGLEKVA